MINKNDYITNLLLIYTPNIKSLISAIHMKEHNDNNISQEELDRNINRYRQPIRTTNDLRRRINELLLQSPTIFYEDIINGVSVKTRLRDLRYHEQFCYPNLDAGVVDINNNLCVYTQDLFLHQYNLNGKAIHLQEFILNVRQFPQSINTMYTLEMVRDKLVEHNII